MKSQPLSSQIADRLADEILAGEKYKPGQRLPTERELAEALGASRTCVREAAKQLEARGLLLIKQGAGTFVAENPGVTRDPLGVDNFIDDSLDTVSLLIDWYKVRQILEGEAMKMVAKKATDEELDAIEQLMLEEVALTKISGMDFLAADQRFHCALARATHSAIMERLVPSLHASVYYDMVKSLYSQLRSQFNDNAVQNHASIVRYLKLRNGDAASLAMRLHMLVAIDDMYALREDLRE